MIPICSCINEKTENTEEHKFSLSNLTLPDGQLKKEASHSTQNYTRAKDQTSFNGKR